MSDNPYDSSNVRSLPFHCHVVIEDKHDDPSRKTLGLKTSEIETFACFDPSRPHDDEADDGLPNAIATVANRMLEVAQKEEAGRWIEDHENVYVVEGHTGKQTWPVRAFLSRNRAEDWLCLLNDWCHQHSLDPESYRAPENRRIIDPDGKVARNSGDPGFRIEDTGVWYTMTMVPVDMFDPIREG